MTLAVEDVRPAGEDVVAITLRHPRKPLLPAATAGAHVDVHLPDGRVRHYSLCGDPADRAVYRIAVKREEGGRGASRWLHETLRPGQTLVVSAPRNHFALEPAHRTLLLGAGIGVTPLLAMARSLAAEGRDFHLHVAARSRAAVPLADEIAAAIDPRRVSWHLGDEPGGRLDLAALLAEPRPGTAIYCCGPARFMDAVATATAAWPEGALHREAFAPLDDADFVPAPFAIAIASSGIVLPVPAERSALAVLREAGIELSSTCEIGVCGSCECGILDGTPIHRDVVLSPRARRDRFIPCVSRAEGTIHLAL